MISWFRKKPNFLNQEFADMSLMLTQDEVNVTYRRDLLQAHSLDFSLESLRAIDAYLEGIAMQPPDGQEYGRLVLRAGAYVGEVMRKQRPGRYNWINFDEAIKHSKLLSTWQPSIATAGILWSGGESFAFPLGKVIKFIENGTEDSLHAFAKVLIEKSDG